ncbi:MAG: hypothetical protein KGM24_10735 [Elusimicrobia bacterium]|nr:hypothetical protein [Elusimicrobiota bacterium]
MKRGIIAAAAAAALAACAGVPSRVANGKVENVIDQTAERGGAFEAIGIGAADPALKTDTQRKAVARDAAIVKAQYELLAMVEGVTLTGGVRVDQAMEKDSDLQTRVQAMIRGAEVVKSEFTADDGCVVTLRLPKSRLSVLTGTGVE